MSRLTTKRAVKVENEFTRIETSLMSVSSNLTRDTAVVTNLTGWMHDNILTGKGDVDETDRADFNIKFSEVYANIQAQLDLMAECYAVYDDDPTIYAANLAAFIIKYPAAEASLVEDSRF